MGQYFYVVNLDKREYIKPHNFGQGAKLGEFIGDSNGVMAALGMLLTSGEGYGDRDDRIVGRWAGDRITIVGDYSSSNKFLTDQQIRESALTEGEVINLYEYAAQFFENISDEVQAAIPDMNWGGNRGSP